MSQDQPRRVTGAGQIPDHDVWPANFDWDGYGFETRMVRAGEYEDETTHARVAPIHVTNAFTFESFDQQVGRFDGSQPGPLYSRHLNPTNQVAERRIASLEGATGAILVSSGQAAVTNAVLGLVGSGQRLVSAASIYGGTKHLFDLTLPRLGVSVDYVWDVDDADEWDAAITPDTTAIYVETIPNPKNDLVDLDAVSRVAARHGLPLLVDSTMATPYLNRPLEHGAHIVLHSSTKFLGGHGTGISGVIVDGGRFDWANAGRAYPQLTEGADGAPSFLERYGIEHAFEQYLRATIVNDFGPAVSPFTTFLLQQGLETLALRMERHCDNALAVARWLEAQPAVESVDYAGLESNPRHALAVREFRGKPGAVFAFTVRGGIGSAAVLIDRLRVFSRMTNIGDTRSMVLHTGTSTHAAFDEETRRRLGIDPGLVRLSIGIETVDDLIADLADGLAAVEAHLERAGETVGVE